MTADAVKRIRRYLWALPQMGGISHETVHTLGIAGEVVELTVADLEAVLARIEELEAAIRKHRDAIAEDLGESLHVEDFASSYEWELWAVLREDDR